MLRMVFACAWLLGGTLGSGCVVVERRPTAFVSRSCHPSQSWDGSQCRHKGNGHGARKHDGAPRGAGKSKGKIR
jgi:hypothetical protein